ncbi:DUF3352 domain-containing protein [uncultured Bacteroides sp.]|uniref:DUF3352 domain-containing protein n=1 Tax=uncultured Bacteroides sp. TaxID=162156 RepID=UPI002676CA98|nr:DUF3352 domain-containing protein [uncultured Bacteroides sp.]
MKLRTIVKIAVTSSVVLLCAGFASYSFFKLSAAEGKKDFNLYELVPASASAVFVTDDMLDFVAEIDGLACSKNRQYLHASKIFSYLKECLYTLLEDAPHGLSRQMNRMLISFHEPDNIYNQILYCRLGESDRQLLERFANKYILSLYPPKIFKYRGEKITIYPMADGNFLACYLTSDFMALSYQKKLIEDVIDTYKGGISLADDSGFVETAALKKNTAIATVYTRWEGMMGWTEFDMKLRDDFIYLTGVSHEKIDTCLTFADMLRKQDSVKGFPGERLPSTAFYFSKQGISDWTFLLSYGGAPGQEKAGRTDEIRNRDRELSRYLIENAGQDLIACLFQHEDTLRKTAAVLSISVADAKEAERTLRSLVNTVSQEEGRTVPRISLGYTAGKAYPVYRLPQTSLFERLTGFTGPVSDVYAVFYGERLLFAPDEESLFCYIRQLDKGEVLDGAVTYRAGMDSLSDSYHFMLVADFDRIFQQSETLVRFVPDFFLHHAGFFRNFTLFVQFICTDGVIYPNLVLKYQAE